MMEERILNKIKQGIRVDSLKVINESNLHFGHTGAGEETHFKVEVKSDDFRNRSKIEIHRMINNLLKDEFRDGLHALSINILK